MTMPHLQNCDHSDDGWCLPCVKRLWNELQTVRTVWSEVEREERLRRAAERIVENYRQTGFDPEQSTDNAVMLAVDYLKCIAVSDARTAKYLANP